MATPTPIEFVRALVELGRHDVAFHIAKAELVKTIIALRNGNETSFTDPDWNFANKVALYCLVDKATELSALIRECVVALN